MTLGSWAKYQKKEEDIISAMKQISASPFVISLSELGHLSMMETSTVRDYWE